MTTGPDIRHHEDEAIPGLPERLPAGETILWQGSPDRTAMALTTFPVGWIAAWFLALATWRGITMGGAVDAALAVSWTLAVGAVACGILAFIGWAAAWTSLYTITNRRVVMRVGIAVDKCVNLPFAQITGAGLKARGGGRGDLALELAPEARIGWLVFWPHVRPFPLSRPAPRLTALPDAARVAGILQQALVADAARRGVAVEAAGPVEAAPSETGQMANGSQAAGAAAASGTVAAAARRPVRVSSAADVMAGASTAPA
jgi:hypothetical protein